MSADFDIRFPIVTAVMLTGDVPARRPLAYFAIDDFLAQTYASAQLLIVNQGRPFNIQHDRIREYMVSGEHFTSPTLGQLRNIGIDFADADYTIVWDDDDYHHPQRIEAQIGPLLSNSGLLATFLKNRIVLDLVGGSVFARKDEKNVREGCSGTILCKTGFGPRYCDTLSAGTDEHYASSFQKEGCFSVNNDPKLYCQTYSGLNFSSYATVVTEPRATERIKMRQLSANTSKVMLYRYQNVLGLLGDFDSPIAVANRAIQARLFEDMVVVR